MKDSSTLRGSPRRFHTLAACSGHLREWQLITRQLWWSVEPDFSDRFPVAGIARPSLWMFLTGRLIDGMAFGEQALVNTAVTLIRGDVANAAVAVLMVVPTHEGQHPITGRIQVSKALIGIARSILAGAKDRLGVGIVVTDSGTAVGGPDTQVVEGHHEGCALLWTAVVGMQHPWRTDAALRQDPSWLHLASVPVNNGLRRMQTFGWRVRTAFLRGLDWDPGSSPH